MEKILALFDQDPLYLNRFARYIESRRQFPFTVYSFKDIDSLRRFADRREIDLLLAGQNDCADALQQIPAGELVFLSEQYSADEAVSGRCIYKYQSGGSIIRELMGMYGDMPDYAPSPSRVRGHLYLVFSPIGRSGKTRFAQRLAKELSRETRTLCVTMEEIPLSFRKQTHRATLTEALYYFKQGNLNAMKLQSLLYDADGLCYLAGMRNPEDISALSAQELTDFTDTLLSCGFRAVVIDTDSILSRFSLMFSAAERVFIPVTEDAGGIRKLESLDQYLSLSFAEPVLTERFIRLRVPACNEETDFQKDPVLGDFVRTVIRNYIYGESEI